MNPYQISAKGIILDFLENNARYLKTVPEANEVLKDVSGINKFFCSVCELKEFVLLLENTSEVVSDYDKQSYGDFQTNMGLAQRAINYIHQYDKDFEFVLEPTCGKGNFIIASLNTFETIKKVIGVEAHKFYVQEAKMAILKFFLENKDRRRPNIDIVQANIFDYDFCCLPDSVFHYKMLVVGNPPWVTNSALAVLESGNLPKKSNFKNYNGFDAITGKGNFDIGEYILLLMLNKFHLYDGVFSFLIKNSVIKNILEGQPKIKYHINSLKKLSIDTKKEFNASVESSLFYSKMNRIPSFICEEEDLYSGLSKTVFGWYKGKFVYSIPDYKLFGNFDGKSPLTWRQGLKHDCSKVMELEKVDGEFVNKENQVVDIEKDLVYELLKSSDLKEKTVNSYRKFVIVTQKKVGQDTMYIKEYFPHTFNYLNNRLALFNKRKSSIYKGKPIFSIFGIGDYSFKPYKVAISGLYKTIHFTLVLPENGKPVMLDDTCYFLSFENLAHAVFTHFLLNLDSCGYFLKSIIFPGSKRQITKGILMRIDLCKLYKSVGFDSVKKRLTQYNEEDWIDYGVMLENNIIVE